MQFPNCSWHATELVYVDNVISGSPIEESAVQYIITSMKQGKSCLKQTLTSETGLVATSHYTEQPGYWWEPNSECTWITLEHHWGQNNNVLFRSPLIQLAIPLSLNEAFCKILQECMTHLES